MKQLGIPPTNTEGGIRVVHTKKNLLSYYSSGNRFLIQDTRQGIVFDHTDSEEIQTVDCAPSDGFLLAAIVTRTKIRLSSLVFLKETQQYTEMETEEHLFGGGKKIKLIDRNKFCVYGEELIVFIKRDGCWRKGYVLSAKNSIVSVPQHRRDMLCIHTRRQTHMISLDRAGIEKTILCHPTPITSVSWNLSGYFSFVATLTDKTHWVYREGIGGELAIGNAISTGMCPFGCRCGMVWARVDRQKKKRNCGMFFLEEPKTETEFLLGKYDDVLFYMCGNRARMWGVRNMGAERNVLVSELIAGTTQVTVRNGNFCDGDFLERQLMVKSVTLSEKTSTLFLNVDGSDFVFSFRTLDFLRGHLILYEVFSWMQYTEKWFLVGERIVCQHRELYSVLPRNGGILGRRLKTRREGELFYSVGERTVVSVFENIADVFLFEGEELCFLTAIQVPFQGRVAVTGAEGKDRTALFFVGGNQAKRYDVFHETKTHQEASSVYTARGDIVPVSSKKETQRCLRGTHSSFCFGYFLEDGAKAATLWSDTESEWVVEVGLSIEASFELFEVGPAGVVFTASKNTVTVYDVTGDETKEKITTKNSISQLVCSSDVRNLFFAVADCESVSVYSRQEQGWVCVLKQMTSTVTKILFFSGRKLVVSQQTNILELEFDKKEEAVKEDLSTLCAVLDSFLSRKNKNPLRDILGAADRKTAMTHYLILVTDAKEEAGPESWEEFKEYGCCFWMGQEELKRVFLKVAASEYKQNDVFFCALLYVVAGKKSIAIKLLKNKKSEKAERLACFMERDFSVEENRKVATKNAFSLIRKQEYTTAATLFICAGEVKDFCFVCRKYMQDVHLVFVLFAFQSNTDGRASLLKEHLKERKDIWETALLERLLCPGETPEVLCSAILEHKQKTQQDVLAALVYLAERKHTPETITKKEQNSFFEMVRFLLLRTKRETAVGVLEAVEGLTQTETCSLLTMPARSYVSSLCSGKKEEEAVGEEKKEVSLEVFREPNTEKEKFTSSLLICSPDTVLSFLHWNGFVLCSTEKEVFEIDTERDHHQLVSRVQHESETMTIQKVKQGEEVAYPNYVFRRATPCLAMDLHPTEPLCFTSEHGRDGVLMSRFGEKEPSSFFHSTEKSGEGFVPRVSLCGTFLGVGDRRKSFEVWPIEKKRTSEKYQLHHDLSLDFSFSHTLFFCCGRHPNGFSMYDRLLPKSVSMVYSVDTPDYTPSHIRHTGIDEKRIYVYGDDVVSVYDIRNTKTPTATTKTNERIAAIKHIDERILLGCSNGVFYLLDGKTLHMENGCKAVKQHRGENREETGEITSIDIRDDFIYFCFKENGIRRIPSFFI
ncbi:MAG: uncharacterized protein A8A55_0933 [Amphiamblys sp. WSBS2006]|nr:MAG: uncharacterized protein A8A55_0933 [Amphiamblys sp. WSBS2006]